LVDGKVAGSIPSEHTVEISVGPGHHTLRLCSGRNISPEHSFDLSSGESISFRTHGATIWPINVTALATRDLGIVLKPDKGIE
jgi:hypothetical protein